MKRLTIDVKDVKHMTDGTARVVFADGHGYVVVDQDAIVSVEDVPDPLPTDPGVKFWARFRDSAPEWWFSQKTGHGELVYRPAEESPGDYGLYVYDNGAGALVCLPDPEVTS